MPPKKKKMVRAIYESGKDGKEDSYPISVRFSLSFGWV